ncbi:MAG: sorbosone dehydrogenase family protein, partial [Lewinella sp.]|nr:sorbosone dehydrogenase family protein [Lewinella sp.]
MTKRIALSLLSVLVLLIACSQINPPRKSPVVNSGELPLDKIKLPKGFKIALYAENVKNARSMDLSPNGTLFVGTRDVGAVYALRDKNGDKKADEMFTIAKGLKMPNGVAFRNGDLYVAEVNRIIRFKNIEDHLSDPPKPEVIFDGYPRETHHGWKYI